MKKNQIYMIQGTDYKTMTVRLLERVDLSEQIRMKEKAIGKDSLRIAIKPNLVSPTVASYGATTHPEVVAGLIEYLQAHGYDDVVMMEGSWVGDRTEEAYEVCGYRDISEKYNVPFLDMQKEKGVAVDCEGLTLSICKAVQDADFLINVPVLKGHCQTKITCALKNMKGLIPNAEKRHFHAMNLHKPIAHLNVGIHQDFILVDNICGDLDFEDGGNPVEMNRLFGALDPVLMDAYVCQMMHYEVDDVPYVRLAEQLGVGCADIGTLDLRNAENDDRSETELMPLSRKVVELADAVWEVDSCSACYGYLLPALERLKEEGLLDKLPCRICIGQGYRGQSGELGIGHCTAGFKHHLEGCPPTENQIYDFLRAYIGSVMERSSDF